MSEITPQVVKTLREKTGAGMADCKKALVEANGDMNLAIEILRKKGAASAAKRADKSANEGAMLCATTNNGKVAVLVEVNCETDFVARNAEFDGFVKAVLNAYLTNDVNDWDGLKSISVDGETIENKYKDLLTKFSEKIDIQRLEKFTTDGFFASYVHVGNKLNVIIEVDNGNLNEHAQTLVRDIALQVAAMDPQFVDRSQVDNATLEKEVEIYKQQAIDSGKKEEIAEKIATGRLEKFYGEQCLVEQAFIKDGNKVVGDVLAEISKEAGAEVKIRRFIRYILGVSTN